MNSILYGATATNLITNGDFSNGTTGWTGVDGVISAANNEATLTLTATSNYSRILPLIQNIAVGKHYVSFEIYPKYANGVNVYTTTATGINKSFTPVANSWNKFSFIADAHTAATVALYFMQGTTTNYVVGDTN